MIRILRRSLADNGGIAALEFAVLAPALLTIAFAVVVYSIYFTARMGVREAATEGARAAVVGLSSAERTTLAHARAEEVIAGYAGFLGGTAPVVSTAPVGSDAFTVTVSCDMSGSPIMRYGGFLPLPSPNVAATVTIMNGSY